MHVCDADRLPCCIVLTIGGGQITVLHKTRKYLMAERANLMELLRVASDRLWYVFFRLNTPDDPNDNGGVFAELVGLQVTCGVSSCFLHRVREMGLHAEPKRSRQPASRTDFSTGAFLARGGSGAPSLPRAHTPWAPRQPCAADCAGEKPVRHAFW